MNVGEWETFGNKTTGSGLKQREVQELAQVVLAVVLSEHRCNGPRL